MTEEAVAAQAAPEPTSTPDVTGDHPAPPDPGSVRMEPTSRGAIDRAFAALEARETGEKPQAEQLAERPRNPDGTFASKDVQAQPQKPVEAQKQPEAPKPQAEQPTNFVEPPKRFSADAKAAWAQAPEPVRAEITRAVKELEQGIAEYQTRWEPLKEFDALARQHGTTLDKAMANYVGIEQLIARDPLRGLNQVCENMGLSLREIAARIMGQTPDQNASQQDATIRELRNEIAGLKRELGGVSTTIRSEKEQATLKQIEDFASQPEHARFEELSEDIALFLKNGRAKDLQEAYELADRLNPVPQAQMAPAPAASAAPPADAAHTRKGQLSLSGAPSSGSNPANRKPPSSAREALDRSFAALGL